MDIFEKNGWIVECESPFEIRHEDGSFASGQAAKIIKWYLEEDDAYDTLCKGICIFMREECDHKSFESDEKVIGYIKRFVLRKYT